MEKKVIKTSWIKGWAMDANPYDMPNSPFKNYTGDDHNRKNWIRPLLQKKKVEILQSTERPYLSAAYGTTVPPSGLSGMIRRFAFKYSENMYRHWLPLILADRIDMFESYLSDFMHGYIPNFAKERGWHALAKHKPSILWRVIGMKLLFLVVAGLVVFWIVRD